MNPYLINIKKVKVNKEPENNIICILIISFIIFMLFFKSKKKHKQDKIEPANISFKLN